MTAEQLTKVQSIMRTELDIIAQRNWAREEGLAEGKAQGRAQAEEEAEAKQKEFIERLRSLGVEDALIQQALSRE